METKLKEIIGQYLSDEKLIEELTKEILEIAAPRDIFMDNEGRN